eukprot:TRINITY_DN20478_c0_g1_i1.p1 TRINITY_DN20478_c0_g1~~TRINITY_DN20478_c0_g1_i1.p1  ORF type:complete len:220 (+),score=29.78 TRINITY_DN20478_c0_g1_i1:70-729(+)
MEVPSSVNSAVPKRVWNFLRIAFFMMRKGFISKRKLIMDMNLMMKRGKLLRKNLGNLMFHHSRSPAHGYGIQDYEFSCKNSPNPVFLHVTKRKHHYFPSIPHFPCINPPEDPEESDENKKTVVVLPKIEYSPAYSYTQQPDAASDLAVGEKMSPLASPFSVRVSEYCSEDENDSGNHRVDDEAEEFIKRFYEQLRVQSRTALLQYQETEYREMLARGTR